VKKTPATLARQIERGMRRAKTDCASYEDEHCTLYENDLELICPRKDKDRRKKLLEFATQHGFRLRFYREGLFAIFGLRTPPVAVGAVSRTGPIPSDLKTFDGGQGWIPF
jgi:hypothetical protein